LRREKHHKIRELNRAVTGVVVNALIEELKKEYLELPDAPRYLADVQKDIVDNAENFREPKEGEQVTLFGMPLPQAAEIALNRYRVNVLIDHGESKGVKFGSGQPIFQADSDAEYFYLIDQGSVGLEMFVRGKGVIAIETIGAGEALGWSWLFPPYRWHFSARSHAATEAVAFAAPVLRQYAEANHSFGYELAMRVGQVMLQRLQATRAKLVNFYGAIKDN